MSSENPPAVFVYGTLKSDQCRGDSWPHPPLQVIPTIVSGRLFDLVNYPAMIHGDHQVLGELWTFPDEAMKETLRILDLIEGFESKPTDEYRREVVSCRLAERDSAPLRAHTYFYMQHERLKTAKEIMPNKSGQCSWPSVAEY